MAFDFIQLIVYKGRRDIVLCGRQGSIISFEMQISHSINLHICVNNNSPLDFFEKKIFEDALSLRHSGKPLLRRAL